ncbi:MAG: hypothetical protein QG561_221 [Patescibacteria group bacterium]|nr:hypothetical protein [Patescibacteria group bacterium]
MTLYLYYFLTTILRYGPRNGSTLACHFSYSIDELSLFLSRKNNGGSILERNQRLSIDSMTSHSQDALDFTSLTSVPRA